MTKFILQDNGTESKNEHLMAVFDNLGKKEFTANAMAGLRMCTIS